MLVYLFVPVSFVELAFFQELKITEITSYSHFKMAFFVCVLYSSSQQIFLTYFSDCVSYALIHIVWRCVKLYGAEVSVDLTVFLFDCD